jgi:transcriptional regulator with XRE-family HTH domain
MECFKNAGSKDLSINEIAKLAGVSRLTASKYIEVLRARGMIMLTRYIGKAKMFQIAPEYGKATTTAVLKEEKPMIKVEFLKRYFQYKPGQIILLEEDVARELFRLGYVRELKV